MGTTASNFNNDSLAYELVATTTTIAFSIWIPCALVLLVRLCRWWYATRANGQD
jgi:hypothetical protein